MAVVCASEFRMKCVGSYGVRMMENSERVCRPFLGCFGSRGFMCSLPEPT